MFLLETLYALTGINPYIAHTAHLGVGIAGVLVTALLFPRKTAEILSALIDALIPVVPERPIDAHACTYSFGSSSSSSSSLVRQTSPGFNKVFIVQPQFGQTK